MSEFPYQALFRNTIAAFFVVASTAGCLSSEDDPGSKDGGWTESRLSGSVGDGPVIGAAMRATTAQGLEIAAFESNAIAGYDIVVSPPDSAHPLRIESAGGTDLVTGLAPDFDMFGVVLEPGKHRVANVNPFSTFATRLAEDLPGGMNAANFGSAESTVSSALNSGLTSLADSGPSATHIDETNIAEIVKASETLAEAVRRTRDLLDAAGFPTDGNAVINALASDLIDGVVNGAGGPDTDARTAAVMTLAYAQVLMESMANELHVNGSDASSAMEAAINAVAVRPPTSSISDQRVTSAMVAKARVGLAAAFAIDARPEILDLHVAVSGLQADMQPSLVSTLLPTDYRTILTSTLTLLAGADATTISVVNSKAGGDGAIDLDNGAPSISGSPSMSVEAGTSYSFTPNALDPDGDSLTFSVLNLPPWAQFNAVNGSLTGDATTADIGTYGGIVITVSDGEHFVSLPTFSITVFEGNAAPVISGTPATSVQAGQSYVFQPSASDPNGDALTFSIINQPPWTSFNVATGRLSGAPFANDIGIYSNIVISVSDGEFSDSLPMFTINVQPDGSQNSPPTIGGNPQTDVNAGITYSFTPTAADIDNDPLTFSITNLPSWASFDTATGTLSGTPGDADVGTYGNITITVTDGTASAGMSFTITVQAISLGAVTLNWTPPTLNSDGTALTDLAGYIVFWGTAPGSYSQSVTLDNAGITSYVVEDLAPGTYYFAAKSYNLAGEQSQYSGEYVESVP